MIQSSIIFTQGDTATLTLTAVDADGNGVDLTGAVFTTYINDAVGVISIFPNSQHTANPDQVNFPGQFTLTLSSADTDSCGLGAHKEILTKIVIGSGVIYYRGFNALTVYPPVPLQ